MTKYIHTLATFSKEKSGLLMYFLTLVMSEFETLSLLNVLIYKIWRTAKTKFGEIGA